MNGKALDTQNLFKMADGFHDSALLHFAHYSGLFELLSEPSDVDMIAGRMSWNPRRTRILLNALVALELVDKDPYSGHFFNSQIVDRHLLVSSAEYMGNVVEHQRRQWDTWARIGESLAASEPLPWHQERKMRRDKTSSESFHLAMKNLARANMTNFLATPISSGNKFIIDMAGSHGLYLASLAAQNSGVTGEVWDVEEARNIAEGTFREMHCDERCSFVVKDISAQESYIGVAADVVLLNDCMHYFEPDTVCQIIGNATSVLRPHGHLLLATQLLNRDEVTPTSSAGFSMHMMLNSFHGGLHATPWLMGIMREHKLSVEQAPLDPTGRYVLLAGLKE